jgi:hypothetical protein
MTCTISALCVKLRQLKEEHPTANRSANGARLQFVLACAAILALATALRVCGALNDLWLDEVWSLKLVSGISSPWQVFTSLHLDNNHYLNGLWLYFLGPQGSAFWYRFPGIVAGAGSVVLAGLIGRRRDPAAAFFAMLLTGSSYALVLYSSEARGYSTAVVFSFLAFYALDLYLERPRWQMAALYSLSALLGLASHLIFVSVLLASIAWSVWRTDSIHASRGQLARCLFSCQAAPALFLAWLYFVDIRQQVEGGGGQAHLSLIETYGAALAWALGTPSPAAMKILFCLATIVIFCAGLRLLWRGRTGSVVFFAGVILVFPILLAVVRNAETIYIRYFIISIAFLLILASFVLASLYHQGPAGKGACCLLLGVYFAANGWHVAELFKYGRGQYREAIHYMAARSHGPEISIDSDNDFQVPLMLDYYADAMEGKKVEYRLKKSGPWGAEWLVCQKDSLDDPAPPHARFAESAGCQYELVKTFPTAPLSGLRWYLYQKRAGSGKPSK